MKVDDISKVARLASERERLCNMRVMFDKADDVFIHTGSNFLYVKIALKDHPRIVTSLRTEIETRLEAIEMELKVLGVECAITLGHLSGALR